MNIFIFQPVENVVIEQVAQTNTDVLNRLNDIFPDLKGIGPVIIVNPTFVTYISQVHTHRNICLKLLSKCLDDLQNTDLVYFVDTKKENMFQKSMLATVVRDICKSYRIPFVLDSFTNDSIKAVIFKHGLYGTVVNSREKHTLL